ncbi:MAG: carboxypeptidase regulatory-like domain-containing protein [Kofleriaceae bacterium]
MSTDDDATSDAAGSPTAEAGASDSPDAPASSPDGPPAVPVRRGSRSRRLAILGAIAIALSVSVFLIARRGASPSIPTAGSSGTGGSGAAIRAPEGPTLPADDPTGVRLTGFVIDGAGNAVVGAEVTAEIEKGVIDKALAPSTGAGSGSGSAVATPVVHTGLPTGQDGRFVIGGLAPGRYRLRVSGKGLLPAEVRFVPVPSDATRIVVARQVSIAGVVLDEGKPAGGITVGLRGDAIGGGIETKSGADGTFAFDELPEGRYQLFAYKGALAARAVRVNRLGTGPFAPIELRLEPATIVVGRIIDKDEGIGLVGAVELRPSGDDQAPRYARSGDDGVFRIEGVPNGRWIADAFSPGYLSPGGVEMEAGKGVPELALAKGAVVEGKVVDGEGKPIEGATVRALGLGDKGVETSELVEMDQLRRFSGILLAQAPAAGTSGMGAGDPTFLPRGELGVMLGPIPPLPAPGAAVAKPATIDPAMAQMATEAAPLASSGRPPVWTTGADGAFRIHGLPKSKLVVLAIAPGFAEGRSKPVSVEGAQVVTGVDVVLSPGTFIVGKVTDQHRVPVVGAQVSAKPEVGNPMDAFTDAEGEYRIGPVSGTVDMHASSYGHGDANREVELPLAKGRTAEEHREDFTLVVADATLAGTLDDANGTAVKGAQIEVVGGAGDGRRAVVAADGTFSIDMLPAGPLRIRVRHPDYPPAELDTAATSGAAQRVRLQIPLGGAIEGAVIDATSGAPQTSILISATGPGGAVAEATSDKNGRWRLGPLAPGTWKLTVTLPGFLAFSKEVDVTAARTPGQTSVRDVRLDLQRGALVGGTVRDARGQRLAGATVRVVPASGTGMAVEGTTDNLGEFKIRDAPTGDLIITATKDNATGATRATVRPGDEILGLSIDAR